jgi:acyl dehydratase
VPDDPRPEHWLEDLAPGMRFATGEMEVTEAAIAAFAGEWDPQPFHTDPAGGGGSVFGGMVASGWHTAAITMRLVVRVGLRMGGGLVGLGVEDLRWGPVRPGDRLRVEGEVVEVRTSRSRPDRGIARVRLVTLNQRGEEAQHLVCAILVPRRP